MGIAGEIEAVDRSPSTIGAALREAREYTLRLYAHLSPPDRVVPLLDIVNPPAWELAHIGWFQEFWCRRWQPDDPAGARTPSILPNADAWFDSRHVPHDTRWELPLPGWEVVHDYLAATLDDTLSRLDGMTVDELDRARMSLLHEDMHGEAMLMTLHTLALPAPRGIGDGAGRPGAETAAAGDVVVEGGAFPIGSLPERGRFVFDNERDAHTVRLDTFAIARAPVTCGEFAAFVDDGGYLDPRWWDDAGRRWLATAARRNPADWRRSQKGWEQRSFDQWRPVEGLATMQRVSAFEAEAFCRWAGRRLPLEAEWESAARLGAIPCRGNAWEWTATPFAAYPGFVPGAYAEYSAPWFGDHRVLRGGSWATRRRLADPAFRNFYLPHRHDPFVGFRTCPLRPAAGGRPAPRG